VKIFVGGRVLGVFWGVFGAWGRFLGDVRKKVIARQVVFIIFAIEES
jgi:hypothetical protein